MIEKKVGKRRDKGPHGALHEIKIVKQNNANINCIPSDNNL